jgi:hypothetical protein
VGGGEVGVDQRVDEVLGLEDAGHGHRPELGPAVPELGEQRVEHRADTEVDVGEQLLGHPDPPWRGGRLRRGRAAEHPVRPGDELDRAGQRPDGVDVRAHREDPVVADRADGGSQPGDAVHRRGQPHRASGVGTQREVDQAGSDGGARPPAGAAGDPAGVPRVPARAGRGVLAGHPDGELGEVELGHDLGAGRPQPGDHLGVGVGHVVGQEPGGARGAHAGGVDVVLEPHPHAGQRAVGGVP